MVIFKRSSDLQSYLKTQAGGNIKTGFIPTMGALHKGHVSLLTKARNDGLLTICSIFVNPTQFNDKSDFDKYPISTDADIALLTKAGCDILFLPSVAEVYPGGPEQVPAYDFGYLDTILEGAKRPGHFRGVGQVVGRLLEIVQPHALYLGQKDYQQCMVISRLKEILGMNSLGIVICPTTREADGLAMSSRNRRLTDGQRTLAGLLYQCLVSIQSKQSAASFSIVRKECFDIMNAKGVTPEYVAIADANDLTILHEFDPSRPTVALIAARVGDVRLIDNMLLRS